MLFHFWIPEVIFGSLELNFSLMFSEMCAKGGSNINLPIFQDSYRAPFEYACRLTVPIGLPSKFFHILPSGSSIESAECAPKRAHTDNST